MSKSRGQRKSQDTHSLGGEQTQEPKQPLAGYAIFQMSGRSNDPLVVSVTVNHEFSMEVDTGVALSFISKATYLFTWPEEVRPPLKPSSAKLHTYSGESLAV